MLSFLPGPIRGILSIILIILNTIAVFIPLMTVAIIKFIFPFRKSRGIFDKVLISIASTWVETNSVIIRLMHRINWDVHGLENLNPKDWFLILSNHQSWVDILVIQTILLRKVPYLKFFLKKELIWVPLMGVAWWALDFPFMKRYSKKFLKKNPHLRGKDVEVTRKACEKFKNSPISIMNFVEGTRFTSQKHTKQQSQYNHLLKPKAGGIAFVLGAMGDYLNTILNITIVYPQGVANFWEFLCGKVTKVTVHIEKIPVTDNILGDYYNDIGFQTHFQGWVNKLWTEKDKRIDELIQNTTTNLN